MELQDYHLLPILKYLEEKNTPEYVLKKKFRRRFKMILKELMDKKYVRFEKQLYQLTQVGLHYLATNALQIELKRVIGKGKEATIYLTEYEGEQIAAKVHSLGTSSFKNVKKSRMDLKTTKELRNTINRNRQDNKLSSKANCKYEYKVLNILYNNKIRVPKPIRVERNILLMEYIDGLPLFKVSSGTPIETVELLYNSTVDVLISIFKCGYVHNDFNEFNLIVKDGEIYCVDFPQAFTVEENEEFYAELFLKDYQNIKEFFMRRFQFESEKYEDFFDNYA